MFSLVSPFGPRPLPSIAPASPKFRANHTLSAHTVDSVQFGNNQQDLCSKYKLDPDKVSVEPKNAELAIDKRLMLNKILEAYEQAAKLKVLGNVSNRFFGCTLLLGNGTWGIGSNTDMGHDAIRPCGERSATTFALNQAMQQRSLEELQKLSPEGLQAERDGLKVKLVLLAEGHDPHQGSWNSCVECLGWMATDRYFSPDTQIACLTKDPITGKISLRVGSVGEHLEVMGWWNRPSLTDKPIRELRPGKFTPHAQDVLKTLQPTQGAITPKQVKQMLKAAKKEYEKDNGATLLEKNRMGAAVLTSEGRIKAARRIDWSENRMNEPADLRAAAKIFQNALPGEKIVAVAYYGNDIRVPGLPSLGALAQERGNNADTLFIKIQDDAIQMRTLQDCMRYAFDTTVS